MCLYYLFVLVDIHTLGLVVVAVLLLLVLVLLRELVHNLNIIPYKILGYDLDDIGLLQGRRVDVDGEVVAVHYSLDEAKVLGNKIELVQYLNLPNLKLDYPLTILVEVTLNQVVQNV